jgi:hypothetical protein
MNTQIPTNPLEFMNAVKPEQWATNAAGVARTMLTEWEKQAERWAEYGASQATEATRLVRSFQAQAFGVTKSLIETAEKAFQKTTV